MEELDKQKLEALAGKVVGDASASLGILLAYIGDQTGVYRAMADGEKKSVEQIASQANVDTRYLQEMLSANAANGYVNYDASSECFYMSPEQIDRDPDISFSTDTYSLGSVLYEVLSGQTPFDGDTAQEIIDAVKGDEPPPPSSVTKFRVPKLLEEICMQSLKKDPSKRPKNMGEFISILQDTDWPRELLK